jgi:hypothetical protein
MKGQKIMDNMDFLKLLESKECNYYCFTIDNFLTSREQYKTLLGNAKGIYCFFHENKARYVGRVEYNSNEYLYNALISQIESKESQEEDKWRELIQDKNSIIIVLVFKNIDYSELRKPLIEILDTYRPQGFNGRKNSANSE